MKNIFALCLLFPMIACSFTVYKSVDSKGNVVFSQNPSANSVPVELPDPQTITLPSNISPNPAVTDTTTPDQTTTSTTPSTVPNTVPSIVDTLNQQINYIQQLQQQIRQAEFNAYQAQMVYDAASAQVQKLSSQVNYSLPTGQQQAIVYGSPNAMGTATPIQKVEELASQVNATSTATPVILTLTQQLYSAQAEQKVAYQNLQTAQKTLTDLKKELLHVQQNQ